MCFAGFLLWLFLFCYMIARRYFWVLFLRVTGGGVGSAMAAFLAVLLNAIKVLKDLVGFLQ